MKKVKVVLEYELQCTPISIFRAVSTANGLRDWFADKVEILDYKYTFIWDKTPQVARVIHSKENTFIRFRWDDDPNYYFEFRILFYELSGAISLIITDFASESDYHDTVNLWNRQVDKLKSSIGCAKK